MKNEKLLARLLTVIFIISLSFNLFAQEKTKKQKKVIYKTNIKKDGKHHNWKSKDKDVVWHVSGDDFEWDTTFSVDADIDIHSFLKERFPEMDSMGSKRIEIRMDGDNRKVKVYANSCKNRIVELKKSFFTDEDGDIISLHFEDTDSIFIDNKILQNFVVLGDLDAKLDIIHENLDGLKYEIFTSIDEADLERDITIEVLSDIKENFSDLHAIHVYEDGDFDFRKLHHSREFQIILEDEFDNEDYEFLKKHKVKVGNGKLELKKINFYNEEDDLLNLRFKLNTKGKTTIKIINDKGVEVFADKVQYFPGTYDKQTKIDMNEKGTYYITIEQNSKAKAYKMKFD